MKNLLPTASRSAYLAASEANGEGTRAGVERTLVTMPVSRRSMLLGLTATLTATAVTQPWSIAAGATPSEARIWRHLQFFEHGQGIMATVTVKSSGEVVIDAHFSNGKRNWGGVFQVFVGLYDDEEEVAEVSLSAPIQARSLNPWAKTRTTDRQMVLDLSPGEAARIDKIRMHGYRYSAGAPMMIYVKFGDGVIPKGVYPKKPPGLPPYAPNVGYTGATPAEYMPRYRPPAPSQNVPILRPGLDVPYVDPHGNVIGYF